MRKSVRSFVFAFFIVLVVLAILIGFMFGIDNPVPWILIAVLVALPFVHKKLVARNFVEWDDRLSVGIAAIDDDHKRLLDLLNKLQTAAHYHTGEAFEREALDALVDYTKVHFKREEDLMQANEYPDFAAHKQQHEAMIGDVNKFVRDFEENREGTIEAMCQYLKKWLLNHIAGTDQAYSAHLRSRGVS